MTSEHNAIPIDAKPNIESLMEYAIAAAAVAWIAWLVFRAHKPDGGKSKHGFTVSLRETQSQKMSAEFRDSKRRISEFVAENDVAIRDVLEDYRVTHSNPGTVHLKQNHNTATWCLGTTRTQYVDFPKATCVVEVGWKRPWDHIQEKSCGELRFEASIKVDEDALEAERLEKALTNILLKSKSKVKSLSSTHRGTSVHSP